jgi:nucleotide-binding universal stress UspA family protein
MPEKKHVRGVSDKEQRQYEHIKESAKKEGRYRGREKEVAARTVMKQHKEKGHSKGRLVPMKSIVVGYDGSDAAERALRRAAEIADAFSAGLVVVSVSAPAPVSALESSPELAPPAVAGPVAPAGTVPLPEPAQAGPGPEELARRQLERARMSLASRKIETEYVVELGDPAERLLEVADQRSADLIVVGSREHGFLERLLGRSVDEAVARRSERDVLLVH